jgi:DNA-binding GntR family transcriptional regulator
MFVGSMIPNWLQCRREVSQGAKLAYARLAQHAGKDGECFPKQQTLAAELGVSERTANEYVRRLVKSGLIETDRPGLGKANRYFFLDHPWIHEGQPKALASAGQERQESSGLDRQNSSSQERLETSAPIVKENQQKGDSEKRRHTERRHADGLPHSLEEAVEVARQLGIEEEFASQEFHGKKSVGWKDGYGNPITSWPDHLQARWPVEQRKRAERRATSRAPAKRPHPPRQFHPSDYQQPVKDF